MDKPKHVLITGASGFVGWNIARHLAQLGYPVTGTYNSSAPDRFLSIDWLHIDLADPASVAALREVPFDAVVHCAAMPGVKQCAEHPKLAERINIQATREIAEIAAHRKARCIYTSTDLVFDGRKGGSYAESDTPHPPTFYGSTKLQGEEVVRATLDEHYIFRLALVYGTKEGAFAGFLKWTHEALKAHQPLSLFTNQYRSPVAASDIAEAVARTLEQRPPFGTYHIAGPERLNRYEIGRLFARIFGHPQTGIRESLVRGPSGEPAADDIPLNADTFRDETGMNFKEVISGFESLEGELSESD
ncbi:MAG: hypothetical protein CL946_10405 [Ectothiorhodospiraceae bacterium]|nr:hypothetical protein [Ectothiorhodospiraceae bacterium]